MLLKSLVETSSQVAATSGRLAKIKLLADLLKQAGPDEVELAIAYLSGTIRQSRVGVGWATLQKAKSHVGTSARLQIQDVDQTLETISKTAGQGSAAVKQRLLGDLFSRATAEEQDFLFRLLTGELRQGALEGIMVEALAKSAGMPAPDVRRAAMLAGDPGAVAKAALSEGAAGLSRFTVRLLKPIRPMLAAPAVDV